MTNELQQWGNFFAQNSQVKITDRHVQIVGYLKEQGILCSDRTLADVGCGDGTFSLLFCPYVGHVDAIDISMDAIAKLNDRIGDIPQITAICADYHALSDYSADVTFLSMTPVIQNLADITFVNCHTRQKVVVLTVDAGSRDELRHALMERLPPKRKTGFIKNAEWYRTQLTALGCPFLQKRFSSTSQQVMSLDEATAYFTAYFQLLDYTRTECQQVICDYLQSVAVSGFVTERHTLNQTLFVWSPLF